MKIVLALAAVAMTAAAHATPVLTSNFGAENGGVGALQYTGFSQFSVTGGVDLVEASNPYGITTPTAVVDLDGTPGPGSLTTGSFAFGANKRITLTFVLGGAQRGSVSDNFQAGFNFAGTTVLNGYTLGGGYGNANIGNFTTNGIESYTSIGGTSPFTTYSLSFISGNAGSLTANIGSSSADNVGPLLSSVKLDIGAVPEPASWTLMIVGFGLVGAAARRRGFATA